jgi:hypothetical protein
MTLQHSSPIGWILIRIGFALFLFALMFSGAFVAFTGSLQIPDFIGYLAWAGAIMAIIGIVFD